MIFNCPYCRKKLNLMELTLEEDLHAIIRMLPVFGKHGNLVWGYVAQFGISPFKSNSKKLRRLLEEMKALWEGGEYSYQKKRYRISQAGTCEALDVMVKRSFETPLTNHNYLKQVMISISEREAKEDGRQEEKDLRKKEERLMAGDRPLTEEEIAENKRRIQDLIKNIG